MTLINGLNEEISLKDGLLDVGEQAAFLLKLEPRDMRELLEMLSKINTNLIIASFSCATVMQGEQLKELTKQIERATEAHTNYTTFLNKIYGERHV